MKLEDVKKFLEDNKDDAEVKGYLDSLSALDATKIESYLDGDEGKKLLQPRLDKHFSKSLDTWKEKNLQKHIDEAVAKLNPEETPEQKQIRELTERLNEQEKAANREKLLNNTLSTLSEKKLPTELAHLLLTEDEGGYAKNLETFEAVVKAVKESTVAEVTKGVGVSGTAGTTGGKPAVNTEVKAMIDQKQQSQERADKARELYGLGG